MKHDYHDSELKMTLNDSALFWEGKISEKEVVNSDIRQNKIQRGFTAATDAMFSDNRFLFGIAKPSIKFFYISKTKNKRGIPDLFEF